MFIRLLCVKGVSYAPRRYLQALYVSNKKIKSNLRLLTPILDFENRLSNPKEIEVNLKRRGLLDQFNLDDLLAQWEIYSSLNVKKEEIEELQKQTMRLLKNKDESLTLKQREDLKRKNTLELEILGEDLHNCISSLDDIEDKFIDKFLSLPNDVNSRTPREVEIIASFGSIPTDECEHHLAYENSIEYYSNTAYYLKGDTAKFDNNFSEYCLNYFRKQNFVDFSNPDFAKTISVEGAGLPLEKLYEVPHELDIHHTNLMHLTGNSSMLSFMGYFIQLLVWPSYLPIQLIASGQQYDRTDTDTFSLYNVSQLSTVQIFQAGTADHILHKFDETLQLISQFFQKLNMHFRIIYVPAKELHPAESLSAKIQMYSPHTKSYIEVGNLNYYSDYISKRLLFSSYKDQKTNEIDFPHIVSGTVCNLTRILAIILETYNGTIPKNLWKDIS